MSDQKWEISDPVFEGDQECPLYKAWPWNGHRFFGYDLIKHLKPHLLVELGTYWGTSFFTFCQAVKDEGLKTRCVAVDTWAGDEHTGEYGNDVFATVNGLCDGTYQSVNTELIRSYFVEAVNSFADNSISLLHIDGLHTYEAVSEDFRNWLPKLEDNGVVLFHDIADSCDYGSVKFWKEISSQYPSFTFQHSWGLGILFPKGDLFFQFMKANNFSDKQQIYEHKSELALSRLQNEDLQMFNNDQDRLIKKLETDLSKLKSDSAQLKGSTAYKLMRKLGLS